MLLSLVIGQPNFDQQTTGSCYGCRFCSFRTWTRFSPPGLGIGKFNLNLSHRHSVTRSVESKKLGAIALPLLFFFGLTLVWQLSSGPALAQELPLQQVDESLLREFQRLSGEIERLPEDELRDSLAKRMKAVEVNLVQLVNQRQEIEQLEAQLDDAEAVSQSIREQISSLKQQPPPGLDVSRLEFAELNLRQTELQTEIDQLQAEQRRLEQAITERRRENIDVDLAETNRQIQAVQKAIDETRSTAANMTDEIRLLELQASQLRLEQNRAFLLLQQRRAVVNEQFDLDRQQLELVSLKLARTEARKKQIDDAIIGHRQQTARNQAVQASAKATEVSSQYPLLILSENNNVSIAQEIQKLEKEAATTARKKADLHRQFSEITNKFFDTQERIRSIGHSDTVGAMLRKRKSELPSANQQKQQAATARQRLEEIQFAQFQTTERLAELSPATIRSEIEESGTTVSADRWADLQEPIAKLIERRREQLRSLDKLLDRLFADYLDIETTNSSVARVVDKFNEYINERILWRRSNKVLLSELKIDKAETALASAEKWKQLGQTTRLAVAKRPWLFGMGSFVLLTLLAWRSRMRKEVDRLGQIAGRGSCATFWPTIRAAILTTLIAIMIPLLFLAFGWAMRQMTPSGNVLFDALAEALITAAQFALPLEVLRRACRRNGLATRHFDWPNDAVEILAQNLNWYVLPLSALVFLISLFIQTDSSHGVDLIERILFVIAMFMTLWFLYRVISPQSGIFSRYLTRNENSWANQTSVVWFTLILLVPIALALLAIAGYYYTALNLTRCLFLTFGFAVVVELGRALIRRFVLVRRRAAHIEKSRRRREHEIEVEREAQKKAAEEQQRRLEADEKPDESASSLVPSEPLPEFSDETADIDANAGQANQLIQLLGWTVWLVGVWFIWSDVLPAMKALDEYKLWGTTEVAQPASEQNQTSTVSSLPNLGQNIKPDVPAAASDSTGKDGVEAVGGGTTANGQNRNPPLIRLDAGTDDSGVSLLDFLVFLAIVLITFIAARNLPNAFEMLFLEELPVDRSARFASKALFSYAIVIAGTVLAMRTLSINWTSIQWLVTALTFGLAFGLQEIFANFVSGIILMFERPIRLGDVITVDEFTGIVTKIRTRATTIVNWDRKEYVIPNRDFITGRLINWTLTDAINRIQFTVGIAYGSDVDRAKKIIFDICAQHPAIIADPPTSITFEEFADNSLNLVVRTFLAQIDGRLAVIDSLHSQINKAFNEAGIEISFPQRDLHLRTIDEQLLQFLDSRGGSKHG